MSRVLNRILENLATRIIFIIYVFFILMTVFFLVFGYFNELNLQKQRQYDKLKGIVSSMAINIDGDAHQVLMNRYTDGKILPNTKADSIYNDINQKLNEAVVQNNLNSPMYTLIFDEVTHGFYYGVRSDDYIDIHNEYILTPDILMDQLEAGGVIPLHKSENGIWLSAFHPIRTSKGKVVAVLEADIEFSEFKGIVNFQYLKGAIVSLLIIIIFFIFFILYTRKILREESKKKRLLANQKRIIEYKNKDIMDSLHYALKIQNAMLPPDTVFKENFKDSFIFYQSKDVVAGDFYWMERIDDDIYIAVADCTGHGVPGAILSIICSNALEKVICEMKVKCPGAILDQVREIVISFLTKGDHEINDGMDIALCRINDKTNELQYAGAYNPIYIVRNNEIQITVPCKQPVGKFVVQKAFKCSSHKIEDGDSIYLFTDGFADQFGGPNKKKFKYKPFRKLLLEHAEKEMFEQREILKETFNHWRGSEEQIDDVCVIGIQV